MHRLLLLLVPLVLCPRIARSQTSPRLAHSDSVERLAPEAIPAGAAFASAVSADNRVIWFTRANAERTDLQLMRTTWGSSGWGAPVRVPFAVGPRQMDPHLSPDGRTLLFTAPAHPDSALGRPLGDWDTWEVDLRLGDQARARKRERSGNTPTQHQMYPSITADGALWVQQVPLAGSADSLSARGVKRVDRSGNEELVPGLSDAVNPWISPNGRLLIFSSGREGGRGDLFVQVRNATGSWEPAVSLGGGVNSADTEYCPSLTPDGQYLLFSRVHYVDEKRIGSDVYVIRTDAVPALRSAIAQSRK